MRPGRRAPCRWRRSRTPARRGALAQVNSSARQALAPRASAWEAPRSPSGWSDMHARGRAARRSRRAAPARRPARRQSASHAARQPRCWTSAPTAGNASMNPDAQGHAVERHGRVDLPHEPRRDHRQAHDRQRALSQRARQRDPHGQPDDATWSGSSRTTTSPSASATDVSTTRLPKRSSRWPMPIAPAAPSSVAQRFTSA